MKGHSRTGGVTKLRDCDAIKGIVFDQTKRKWKELAQLIWDKALGGDHKYIQLILAYKLGKPTELLETKQNIDIKAGLISDASLSREDELAKVLENDQSEYWRPVPRPYESMLFETGEFLVKAGNHHFAVALKFKPLWSECKANRSINSHCGGQSQPDLLTVTEGHKELIFDLQIFSDSALVKWVAFGE